MAEKESPGELVSRWLDEQTLAGVPENRLIGKSFIFEDICYVVSKSPKKGMFNLTGHVGCIDIQKWAEGEPKLHFLIDLKQLEGKTVKYVSSDNTRRFVIGTDDMGPMVVAPDDDEDLYAYGEDRARTYVFYGDESDSVMLELVKYGYITQAYYDDFTAEKRRKRTERQKLQDEAKRSYKLEQYDKLKAQFRSMQSEFEPEKFEAES